MTEPSTLTAHPAYAYSPRQGAWTIARYHAVLDQDLTTSRFKRSRGDALCKSAQDFWGLEPVTTSPVTCPRCLDLACRYEVVLTRPQTLSTRIGPDHADGGEPR